MTYYQQYNKFRTSRVAFWQPKINKALKAIADNILTQPTLQQAITVASSLQPITDIATVIKSIYIDAGRIMGAYAYQDVMKQGKANAKNAIKAYLINDVMPNGGVQVHSKSLLPIGYNEQLVNDIIAYYQTNLFSEAVLPISDTLRSYILKKLIDAQQTGDSISNVADAIEKSGLVRNHALMIARTETVKAANYGAKLGAQKTGYDMNKVWISAQQQRTRRVPRDEADHLHMNGVEVGMNEPFNVPGKGGFVKMDRPGDSGAPAAFVVNCRCALGFRVL